VLELLVNGTKRQVKSEPGRSLLYVLREELGLTGTKYGCGEGQCGACTVLVGAAARRSCLLKVGEVESKPVVTIEGLAGNGKLHPLQQAFLEADALQCGYCTPGMILAGVALLQQNPKPSPAEIARALEGNICRCGTYPRIVAAVRRAGRV
jgi:aerobic-type carbon monoxide dehydrogenase small subunit (CoxS/CutS family)